jgi:sirohydrochlorin ferrochelatase
MAHNVLVATAHGTDNPTGQAIITSLVNQVSQLLPDVEVLETYVDVQHPQINQVLEGVSLEHPITVVPLLLSTGYHTRHDITQAVKKRAAEGAVIAATPTLGPHAALADIQLDRILASHETPSHVILVAAGSSDSLAQIDAAEQASLLRAALTQQLGASAPQVSVGYLSASEPTVAQAIDLVPSQERAAVVLSSYLLAPGFFQKKLQRIVSGVTGYGGDLHVTEPLNNDPRIAGIVVERYAALRGE